MKKRLIIFLGLGIATAACSALAATQVTITEPDGTAKTTTVIVGPTYGTTEEMIYRIRTLEQAVSELQQKCQLSQSGATVNTTAIKTWSCKVMTRKEFIYGSGVSRGTAEQDAMEKCYRAQGDGAFCKLEECTNQ